MNVSIGSRQNTGFRGEKVENWVAKTVVFGEFLLKAIIEDGKQAS